MTAASDAAEVATLVEAQAHTRQVLTEQTVAGVVAEVRGFRGWHDHAAITRFAQSLADIVLPRQRIMAASTDAYLARVLTALRGKPVSAAGQVKVADLRNGTTPQGTYGRLADYYRYLESQGDPKALDKTLTRAEVLADTDITLADVRQANRTLDTRGSSARIDGFRRVIHPELSRTGTCGLCIVASDRIYKVRELMPIHARCKCEALPIVNGNDPGRHLNAADLTAVYKAAGKTTSRRLKETRFTVHEHGELGPTLTPAGQRFRGPSAVPNLEPAPKTPAASTAAG